MNKAKVELTVGLFAIGVMAILAYMTFKVGDFTIGTRDGYIVYAEFRNTAGLDEKTRVKIAGVNAGVVEKIELVHGVARVHIRLDRSIFLYTDAKAVIKATGLLGDKYIELTIGTKEPKLKEGDTIKDVVDVAEMDDLVKNLTEISASLSEIMRDLAARRVQDSIANILDNLDSITGELNAAITGDKKNLRNILSRLESIMATLDKTVKDSSGPLTNTMKNMEAITRDFREESPEIADNLSSTIKRLNDLLERTAPALESIAQRTDATMGEVQEIAEKVNRGDGTIGKLINNSALYDNISQAAGGVSNTISRVDRFRTFITFRGDYLTEAKDGKGAFQIELSPRENKSYIIGLVSDPIGKVSVTETTVNGTTTREEKIQQSLEFTAQFAHRFKDTTLRIGLTESTFGVGADQHVYQDRIKFTFDAWDFGEDEYLADGPHMRIGADIFATKNLFVSGGYDNFSNSQRAGYFVGAGVRFEDEDFKYLFGSMPSLPK